MADYEQLLSQVGDAGVFQATLFVLMGIVNSYTNLENMAVNFLSPLHAHQCQVYAPDDTSWTQDQVQKALLPPGETCRMYNYTWTVDYHNVSTLNVDNTTTIGCTHGYDFDDSVYKSTATSEFELVCDKATQLDIVSPAYASGFLIGAISVGLISDRCGRLFALMLFTGMHVLAGVSTALSVNVWMYIVSRVLVAAAVRATCSAGAVLFVECIAVKYRVHAMIAYQLAFSAGGLVLVALAFGLRDFRWIQLVTALSLLPIFTYKCFLPESPRWLLMKGRLEEAANAFHLIAVRNKRAISYDEIYKSLSNISSETTTSKQSTAQQPTLGHLLRDKRLRTYLFVAMFLMAVANFAYFGVSMNINQLFGDVYLNMLLSVVCEIPMVLLVWYILERYGRKPSFFTMLVGILVCSGASIAMQLVGGLDLGVTIVSIICRSCSIGVMCTGVCHTTEMFPTSVRQTALASTSFAASIVSIAAPFVGGPMKAFWSPLPDVLYASVSLVSIGLCFLLPETLGSPLPETFEDVKRIGKTEPMKGHAVEIAVTRDPMDKRPPESIFNPKCGTDDQKEDMEQAYRQEALDLYGIKVPDAEAYYGPEHFNTYL